MVRTQKAVADSGPGYLLTADGQPNFRLGRRNTAQRLRCAGSERAVHAEFIAPNRGAGMKIDKHLAAGVIEIGLILVVAGVQAGNRPRRDY